MGEPPQQLTRGAAEHPSSAGTVCLLSCVPLCLSLPLPLSCSPASLSSLSPRRLLSRVHKCALVWARFPIHASPRQKCANRSRHGPDMPLTRASSSLERVNRQTSAQLPALWRRRSRESRLLSVFWLQESSSNARAPDSLINDSEILPRAKRREPKVKNGIDTRL